MSELKEFISNLPKSVVLDTMDAFKSCKNEWFLQVDPETMETVMNGVMQFNINTKTMFREIVCFYIKSKSKKVNDLVIALNKAFEASLGFSELEDGGTCNFDQPVIRLEGWTKKEIFEASIFSGGKLHGKISGKYWKGYRYLCLSLQGQGNRRTKMAESACASLKCDGYDAAMYYQMD